MSWRVVILPNTFIAGLFVFGNLFLFVADNKDGILGFSGEVPGFTCFSRDSSNSCSASFLGHCSLSRILIVGSGSVLFSLF